MGTIFLESAQQQYQSIGFWGHETIALSAREWVNIGVWLCRWVGGGVLGEVK